MSNKLFRELNVLSNQTNGTSEFSKMFNYEEVVTSEIYADVLLYTLEKLLTSYTISIKTALNNASSMETANIICSEYSDASQVYNFMYDTNKKEIYFSSNSNSIETMTALSCLLVHALIIKLNKSDTNKLLSLPQMYVSSKEELTATLINFAKEFYNMLTEIEDANGKTSWHYIDLELSMPENLTKLFPYSHFTTGEIDYNIQSSAFSNFVLTGNSPVRKAIEFDKRDFTIEPDKKFSKIEKERMENNKLADGYVPTAFDKELVERVYNSIKKNNRAPSIFLYGESGTGKSEKGKYLAKKLGIPYTFFCCSATTNEADMRGKPQGLGSVGGLVKFLKDTVASVWNKKIPTTEAQESDEITYTLTEIVLACKYGWIIEIQEPTLIVNAGTLGFLNCVLDDNRVLILPNGEQVPVHPNTTFIFTTNLTYEGCNLLNNSLLSRMDYVVHVKNPTIEEATKRVISRTGFTGDYKDVELLVRAIHEIRNIISENEIMQGICDLRSAIACVFDYMNNDEQNWRKSARLTIEDKAILEPGFAEQIKIKLDSILGEE